MSRKLQHSGMHDDPEKCQKQFYLYFRGRCICDKIHIETRMGVTATQFWIEVAYGERRTEGDGQGLTCVSPAQLPRALRLGVNVLLLLS